MYANDERSSSDENGRIKKYVLFIAISVKDELSDNEDINQEYFDDEGEVNLEGELIYALSELEKLGKKKVFLKE